MVRRRRMPSTVGLRVAVVALMTWMPVTQALGAPGANPSSPNPARPGVGSGPHRFDPPAGAVTAVVVSSWGSCSSSGLIWQDLNTNYSSYGSTPIAIDYSNPDLCGSTFTLAALEASGADVVILDDPSGLPADFTKAEIAALKTYTSEGHNLIGTFLTFSYPAGGVDNTKLAPLFGLKAGAGWAGGDGTVNPSYTLKKAAGALGRKLPNPYVSIGYNQSQRPGDGIWSKNEIKGANLVGINPNKDAAITLYRAGAYDAIFIANMPEYDGGTDDKQFFYNAIIYPLKG
jgi:hypothetical protein